MVQWCIAALPLLLLGAIAIEASHWHTTRQRLALAIQRAVDDASLSGGTTAALEQGLRNHLPSDVRSPVKACITDPVNPLMSDFIDRALSARLGKPVIRHNHLAQQQADAIARGWPNGRGPRSQMTIFEANQLNVRASIKYRPLSSWARMIINPVLIVLDHHAIMQSHRHRSDKTCVTIN